MLQDKLDKRSYLASELNRAFGDKGYDVALDEYSTGKCLSTDKSYAIHTIELCDVLPITFKLQDLFKTFLL